MRIALKALLPCAVMAIVWSNTGVVAAPPDTRSYGAGHFMLEIDGAQVGFVNAVEGGLAFGEVVKEPGEDFFFKKHIASPGVRDIRLEFGADMDASFYHSIALALQGQHVSLNGLITTCDYDGKIVGSLAFFHALITEVGFPALDATSKDAAKMSIVLSPDQTILNRKPSGKLSVKSDRSQKRWLSSSFRLSIDGFDSKKVAKVEALTIKLPRISGCFKCEDLSNPTRIDFPHVVVTMREPAESVYDWFEDFVIQGNAGDGDERGGTLEYLSADLKTLFSLKFSHLGIFEVLPVVAAAGDSTPRLLAAMYCESMEFLVP